MEHSYSRDWRPIEAVQITRTVMVHKPPQCPSCHTHAHDEGVDLEESYNPPIPQYNEEAAKLSMEECEKAAYNVKNTNSDDADWEENINKFGWSNAQIKFFNRITKLLDQDRLARLAYNERQNEAVLRRAVIDKSVHRIRQAFASVLYDTRLLQWLHNLMLDYLPPSYMTIYLDIFQTLKLRLPTLIDKMLFCRQTSIVQELLAPVVKTKSWEPVIQNKSRKLPLSPIIITIPSSPIVGLQSSRLQKWFTLLSTMGTVIPIQMNNGPGSTINKQSIQSLTEHIISVSRAKIQEIRNENPQRPIILAGFNAGASLALQISLVEAISSIICIGFAYNTINGIRGQPDDLILDIKKPILFVIGQNSSRSSQEEIESLREKMISQTSLVVVGSADDFLRVGKNKRKIEKVTQSMVDSMIMDEISEFCTNCLLNPPGPRQINVPLPVSQTLNLSTIHNRGSAVTPASSKLIRKRKISQGADENLVFNSNSKASKTVKNLSNKTPQTNPSNPLPNVKKKVGRPKMHRPNAQPNRQQQTIITQPTTEALNIAIQSILPESEQSVTTTGTIINDTLDKSKILTSYEIINNKIKKTTVIPASVQNSISSSTTTTVSGIGGTPILLPVFDRSKVNIIPSNQFVQLKPPQGNNAQRVYTLKTSPKQQQQQSTIHKQPLYTVRTQQPGENQSIRSNTIYTVKSTPAGTQLLSSNHDNTSLGKASSIVLSPKYTVIKPSTSDNIQPTKLQPDLSSTNIFDIPIVFADNDGNIHDSNESTMVIQQQHRNDDTKNIIIQQQPTQHTTTTLMPSNLSSIVQGTSVQSQQQPRNIIINSMLGSSDILTNASGSNTLQPKHNKTVVLINRNSMKPCSNLITKTINTSNMQPIKFTKVLVNTNKLPQQQQQIHFSTGSNTGTTTFTYAGPATSSSGVNSSNKVEILNSTLIKGPSITSSQSLTTSGGIITSTPSTNNLNKFQPIIIHVDPDNKLRNVIKVSGVNNANLLAGTSDGIKKNTIVLKPNTTFKQIPMLKSGILNKNLTVRKVVNYVTTTGQSGTPTTVTLNKQQITLQPQQQLQLQSQQQQQQQLDKKDSN